MFLYGEDELNAVLYNEELLKELESSAAKRARPNRNASPGASPSHPFESALASSRSASDLKRSPFQIGDSENRMATSPWAEQETGKPAKPRLHNLQLEVPGDVVTDQQRMRDNSSGSRISPS